MENCLKTTNKALLQHDNELKEVVKDGQAVLALLREVPDRPFHEVGACIDQAEMVMRDVVAWLKGAGFDNERRHVHKMAQDREDEIEALGKELESLKDRFKAVSEMTSRGKKKEG